MIFALFFLGVLLLHGCDAHDNECDPPQPNFQDCVNPTPQFRFLSSYGGCFPVVACPGVGFPTKSVCEAKCLNQPQPTPTPEPKTASEPKPAPGPAPASSGARTEPGAGSFRSQAGGGGPRGGGSYTRPRSTGANRRRGSYTPPRSTGANRRGGSYTPPRRTGANRGEFVGANARQGGGGPSVGERGIDYDDLTPGAGGPEIARGRKVGENWVRSVRKCRGDGEMEDDCYRLVSQYYFDTTTQKCEGFVDCPGRAYLDRDECKWACDPL